MKNRTLFLSLRIFSAVGGIEKSCKIIGKALGEITSKEKSSLRIFSMYDDPKDAIANPYFSFDIFKGFSKNKLRFSIAAVFQSLNADVILLSHVHLMVLGWLIKLLNPKKKIILFVHGIEFWGRLNWMQSKMISSVDLFLPVSRFSAEQMQVFNRIDPKIIKVLHHCIDPILIKKNSSTEHIELKQKYSLTDQDQLILSICRISKADRKKGYDKVIHSLVNLKSKFNSVKYLMVGPYTDDEKEFVETLASKLGLSDRLIITGYLSDEEIIRMFNIADVFILPSTKEGFGYVFVEALYFGVPVIAGNEDGAADALSNGEFGVMVDVNNLAAIEAALIQVLSDKKKHIVSRRELLSQFDYSNYKSKLYDLVYIN